MITQVTNLQSVTNAIRETKQLMDEINSRFKDMSTTVFQEIILGELSDSYPTHSKDLNVFIYEEAIRSIAT